MVLTVLVVLLIILLAGGGLYAPAFRTGGFSLAGILLVILVLWLIFGGPHARVW